MFPYLRLYISGAFLTGVIKLGLDFLPNPTSAPFMRMSPRARAGKITNHGASIRVRSGRPWLWLGGSYPQTKPCSDPAKQSSDKTGKSQAVSK